MKLRQRLAMVLVATTVLTAVPVVTMAASKNHVTREVTASKDTIFHNSTTASAIRIEALDAEINETFYLQLENAEWKDEEGTILAGTEGAIVTITGAKEAMVKVTGEDINIPLLVKLTGGEASVYIDGEGSTISSEKFKFAITPQGDELMTLKIGDIPSLYEEGKIADITFEELVAGSTKGKSEKDRTVTITLDNPDYEFNLPSKGEVTIKYGRGLSDETAKAKVDYEDDDYQTLNIILPELTSSQRGTMTIQGLEVMSTTRTPGTGDLKVDISGELIKEQNNVKVADVHEYGAKLEAKDVDTIKAGRTGEIEFTLKEKVKDSIVGGRSIDFVLENGHFGHEGKTKADSMKVLKNAISTITNGKDVLNFDEVVTDVIIEDENIVGFEFKIPTEVKDITVKSDVCVSINATGDVIIKAEGRSIGDDLDTKVAVIEKTIDVKVDKMDLEVGIAKQKGGKVTITEESKGSLQKGEILEITLADENGIRFTKLPQVKVTDGDVVLGDIYFDKEDKNVLKVEVKRASKEASTIEVSDFEVTVSGIVPSGYFDLLVGGKAITECGYLEVSDFIAVGIEKEVIPSYALFTIGSTQYVANGETKTMDVAPYLSEKGRTMIPIRYVADAIGINEQDIVFTNADGVGTVTIFHGDRAIQLRNGENRAIMNGVMVPLEEKVTIKDDRTFVPVGEIGRLLGLDVKWDSSARTATFANGDVSKVKSVEANTEVQPMYEFEETLEPEEIQ